MSVRDHREHHCRSGSQYLSSAHIESKVFGCLHGGVADVRGPQVAADDVRLTLAAA